MPIEIEAPDGSVVEFPDGTDDATMSRAMQQSYGGASAAPAPVTSAPRKSQGLGFAEGMAPAMRNLARIPTPFGLVQKPLLAMADRANAGYADKERQSGAAPGVAGQVLGSMAATAPAMLLPGGAFVQGAAMGALGSEGGAPTDYARDALFGGVGGKVGEGLVRGVGKVVAPRLSDAARLLNDRGIPLTIGQMAGGMAQRVEDKATSVPILGDFITAAQQRGLEGLSRATVDDALKPLGQTLPKGIAAGHDALRHATQQIGDAYDNLLPHLTLSVDPQLTQGMTKLGQIAARLPADKAKQLQGMLTSDFVDRFENGTMTGETLKDVQSVLGNLAADWGKQMHPDDRAIGKAFRLVRDEMMDALERQNPAGAADLRKINQGYGALKRAQDAAARTAGKDGIPTPNNLSAAVKKGDRSKDKKAFSLLQAPGQDLSEAAVKVLTSKIGDSGTAGRVMQAGGLAALIAGAVANPLAAGTAGAALLPYMGRTGQGLAQKAVAMRPAWAPQARAAIEKFARPAGLFGGMAPTVARSQDKRP